MSRRNLFSLLSSDKTPKDRGGLSADHLMRTVILAALVFVAAYGAASARRMHRAAEAAELAVTRHVAYHLRLDHHHGWKAIQ
ncbi:hypothetical protein [Terrarubrum flagellatum]|uniref:hypothetical protein n=1 Tax=Terrirubrum flagellatum TaxID=2895980 RepID=UPI003144FB52